MVAVSLLGGATSIVSANTTANANQTATSVASKKVVYLDAHIPITKDGVKTTVTVKNVKGNPGEDVTIGIPKIEGYKMVFTDDTFDMTMSKDGKSWIYYGTLAYEKDDSTAGSGSSSESNTGSSSSSNNTNSGSSSNTNSGSSSHATGNTGSNSGSSNGNASTGTDKVTSSNTQSAVDSAKAKATSTINKANVAPTVKAQANSQVNKATTAAGTKAVTDAMTKPADTKTGDVQTGETNVIRNLVIAMTAAISATALGAFIIKKVSKQK